MLFRSPTDLGELSQDAVNAALTAGTGIQKTYDDPANTITIQIDTAYLTNFVSQAISSNALTNTDDLPQGVQNLYLSAQNFAALLTAQPNFKSQGVQGIQGLQGIQGTQGTAGYIGADGSQGTQGRTGSQIGRAHV